jgi:hypothetical protein
MVKYIGNEKIFRRNSTANERIRKSEMHEVNAKNGVQMGSFLHTGTASQGLRGKPNDSSGNWAKVRSLSKGCLEGDGELRYSETESRQARSERREKFILGWESGVLRNSSPESQICKGSSKAISMFCMRNNRPIKELRLGEPHRKLPRRNRLFSNVPVMPSAIRQEKAEVIS